MASFSPAKVYPSTTFLSDDLSSFPDLPRRDQSASCRLPVVMKAPASLTLPSSLAVSCGAAVVLSLVLLRALLQPRKVPADKHGKPLFEPPAASAWLGSMLEMARNVSRFHDWVSDVTTLAGGQPWLLRAPGRPDLVVLSTPQLVEDVLKTQFEAFGKGAYLGEVMRDLAGDSIVFADGPVWAFQRKVAVNLFSARLLRESMAATIHENTVKLDRILQERATTGEPFDLSRTMYQFTMEVFAEIGFGLNLNKLGSDHVHEFEEALDATTTAASQRVRMPTPVWKLLRALNVGSERQLHDGLKIVDDNVMSIVAKTLEQHQRRQGGAVDEQGKERGTLVSLFLEHCASENTAQDHKIDAKLLRDIALTLLVAARDTSAEAMCWFLYCLSTRPEVEDKVRAEILAKLPELADANGGASVFVSPDMLQDLTYLEAALRESLRLYPLFAFNRRVAFKDVTLSDGTFIPKDTYVALASYAMGRRTDVWGPDAAEFKPERFLDPSNPSKLRQVSSYQFISFGAGPRSCVGMKLAMLEMKTVLAKTLARFRIVVDPADQPEPGNVTYRMAFSIPIKGGLRVRATSLRTAGVAA
jgi:cytochrome P450